MKPGVKQAAHASKLSWGIAVATAFATILFYAPAIGRGFVSEDFLILRRFHEAQESGLFWITAWQNFVGPWLGLSIVSFFRPLSSLFLQIEWALFGTFSAGYGVIHLLIHLVNAWQVQDLIRLTRPAGKGLDTGTDAGKNGLGLGSGFRSAVPFAAAAIFALYPLHPNTVVFIASFATLLAVGLMLLCLRQFVDGRDRQSLLAFVAALACYEQAAILPLCLLSYGLLDHRSSITKPSFWRTLGRRHLPFWLILVTYLALRRTLLGHSIGGYQTFRERLADPADLGVAMFNSLGRILYPAYDTSVWILSAGMVTFGLWAAVRWLLRRHSANETWALLGLSWILISLAPFSFVGVVPGNGRYWYMATCGLALFWCALLQALVEKLQSVAGHRFQMRQPNAWIILGLALVSGIYASMLSPMIQLYAEAGATTSKIQSQLMETPGERLFLVGAPRFLKMNGVPAAQVFHWGLADALMPPFSLSERQLFPLPPLGDRALLPLAQHGSVLRWIDGQIEGVVGMPADELKIGEPADSAPDSDPISALGSTGRFDEVGRLELSPDSLFRFVVVTRGSYHVEELTSEPTDASASRRSRSIYLPQALVDSMEVLYGNSGGSPTIWWVEQRRAVSGELLAVSRPTLLDRSL